MIRGAAGGDDAERAAFARCYEPVVRAYLGARWNGGPLGNELEDAVQEVFLDCLRSGGALERADPERGGFRVFLHGVVRNVALRHERARLRKDPQLPEHFEALADGPSLAAVFDRAWAQAVLREAGRLQRDQARGDERAERRVDLLRHRFRDGLPIREIAARWDVSSAWLHHEYAIARQEFRRALESVVSFHRPNDSPSEIERETRRLVELFA